MVSMTAATIATIASSVASQALNGVSPVAPGVVARVAQAASQSALGVQYRYGDLQGRLVGCGPYVTNNPRLHGQRNGKLWYGRSFIGPNPQHRPASSCEVPGPAYYGVPEDDQTTILVRVGFTTVGISPWHRLTGTGQQRFEEARLRWLDANGYGSGVRTFVNDAVMPAQGAHAGVDASQAWEPMDNATAMRLPDANGLTLGVPGQVGTRAPILDARTIQPRATIRLPSDMPRFRKRMDVRGVEAGAPSRLMARSTGFSRGFARGYRAGTLAPSRPVIIVLPSSSCDAFQSCGTQVDTVTGRGNPWVPTLVVRAPRDVASAR